jgi:hypothetical protein
VHVLIRKRSLNSLIIRQERQQACAHTSSSAAPARKSVPVSAAHGRSDHPELELSTSSTITLNSEPRSKSWKNYRSRHRPVTCILCKLDEPCRTAHLFSFKVDESHMSSLEGHFETLAYRMHGWRTRHLACHSPHDPLMPIILSREFRFEALAY